LQIFDLSTTGFAAGATAQLALAPGSVLESFELLLGDRLVWAGEAVVVHGAAERLGGRFTSRVLDLQHLWAGATLEGRLALHLEQRERLPAEWRAAVADLKQLLEDVRAEVDEIERSETHDPLRRGHEEAQLFETLRASWGREFYGTAARLHEMSKSLDARSVALGRSYASSMLGPVLAPCPVYRRAAEKPLGYAGDFRLMELFFTRELTGDGLYGRFLHSVAQNYTFGQAVRAREEVTRKAVRQAIEAEGDGPVRILALAAGPAVELRRLLEEPLTVNRPVELILLDQDPAAHETAHRHLTRILLERHHGLLPIRVQCLTFSVRQLLKPVTPDEQRVRDLLEDLDLAYSSGLYDYLPDAVAVRLNQLIYRRLKPSGRLLVGNMVETPDSSWMMDFVGGWSLLYRTDESMLRLAHRLSPEPAHVSITPDATGRCIFLDVTKSRSDESTPTDPR
jgi:hypothetical protein